MRDKSKPIPGIDKASALADLSFRRYLADSGRLERAGVFREVARRGLRRLVANAFDGRRPQLHSDAATNVYTEYSAKLVKGEKRGFLSIVPYLAPASVAGYPRRNIGALPWEMTADVRKQYGDAPEANLCIASSKQCRALCLQTSGRLAMSPAQKAMRLRAIVWLANPYQFLQCAAWEIRRAMRRATRRGMSLAHRTGGTDDDSRLRWHLAELARIVAEVDGVYRGALRQYAYSKVFVSRDRCIAPISADGASAFQFPSADYLMPDDVHLTFSDSGTNDSAVALALSLGTSVAVPIDTDPEPFHGKEIALALGDGFTMVPAINGDRSDLRFLDPAGSAVLLQAKGKARRDKGSWIRSFALQRRG